MSFADEYKRIVGGGEASGDKHAAFLTWYKKNVAEELPLTDLQKIQLIKKRIEEIKKQMWLEGIKEERMPNAY